MQSVSIIVPVSREHNCRRFLGACLDCLGRQTFPKENTEIILVGDGCEIVPDPSLQGVRVTIVNSKSHEGPIASWKKGLSLATGEFVAFTDADCEPDDRWLEHLAEGFSSDDIAGCAGRTVDCHSKNDGENRLYETKYILPCAGFGNVMYRRRVLDELGFLDENLCFAAEEPDFCWRLHLKGYRIEFIAAALVMHKTHKSAKKFFLYGVATRYLMRKYRQMFRISPMVEFRQIWEFHRKACRAKGHYSLAQRIKPLNAIGGYLWALLREKFGFSPALDEVDLSDKTLQPQSQIRPLNVTVASRPLVKPNYVIWWSLEDGGCILNLKTKEWFELSGVSGDIWKGVLCRKRKDEVVESILNDYNLEKNALEEDFDDFIGDLLQQGLLHLSPFSCHQATQEKISLLA